MQLGRQTLSQAVSAAVLDRIRSGEFGPGDRLPTEKSLMQEYGVGRNSVREAVQALVTLGLVDVRPGRGATVIGIESDAVMDAETISVLLKEEAVDDLYSFRRLLEVEIASRAAVAATPRDLEEIAASIRAFESALEQGRPISTLDDEFHAAVAQGQPQRDLRDRARRGQRPDRERPPAHDDRSLGIGAREGRAPAALRGDLRARSRGGGGDHGHAPRQRDPGDRRGPHERGRGARLTITPARGPRRPR